MARGTTGSEDQSFGNAFLQQIIEHIADNFEPEDVFDDDVLELWAKDNGYVLKDDN